MTIHHDKMAYGKLSSLTDEFSEERLEAMARTLNGAPAEQGEAEAAKMQTAEREYDKMIRGELYNPADEELTAMRRRVRRLFGEYNRTEEDETERRRELLDKMFASHGEFYFCEPPVRFDYGINTHVGEDFFSNFNLVILDCAPVRIGKQCFIGPNVTLATPVHPLLACDRNMRRAPNGEKFDYEYARPITIEDNVWLASNVVVCGGVTIGHDTVIGAGSVVTRDIPAGVFAAGNPCRVIRPLTAKDKMKLPKE